jgi:hypothetical protein
MPEDIRDKADDVRNIDLIEILQLEGCVRDNHDRVKWHTCQGVVSVTGRKFMNWTQSIGGGGAIDLVMHLRELDFKGAVFWLSENLSSFSARSSEFISSKPTAKRVFKLPQRDDRNLPKVIDYLRYDRSIPVALVNMLIRSGKFYADKRGNAVFLLLGKEKKVVGAELRGTTHSRWHGMASGSKKGLGAFYVRSRNIGKIVLCESAIDALSYFALHHDCMVVSTSGVNPNPAWLPLFVAKGFEIYCGFDNDETGTRAANKMIYLYPAVKRLRPTKHDWNEVLRSQ